MTVQEIWLANLCAIVDREAKGKNLRAGYRAVAEASGLNVEYIYQLYQKKPKANGQAREISPASASKIAKAFADGRPDGWFDRPMDDTHISAPTGPQKSPSFLPNESPVETLKVGETEKKYTTRAVTPQPPHFVALSWEQFMERILKEGLQVLEAGQWVEIGDDSMSPEMDPGDQALFVRGAEPKAGQRVLVREAGGDILVREYRVITSKAFEVVALNSAYGPLRSDRDGLEILAVRVRYMKHG